MAQFDVKVHTIEHLVMEKKILAILSVRVLREEPESSAEAVSLYGISA